MTRRNLLATGIASASGLAGVAEAAGRCGLLPADSGGIWGPGATLNCGAAHKLLGRNALAREFPHFEVSRDPFANGRPPKQFQYLRHQANDFLNWRLTIKGLVSKPGTLSIPELCALPARSQITPTR